MINVASAVAQTIHYIFAIPEHHLYLHADEEMVDQGADADLGLAKEQEGTNSRKVRKTITIRVFKIG